MISSKLPSLSGPKTPTHTTLEFVKPEDNAEIHITFYDAADCDKINNPVITPGHRSYVGTDCEGVEADIPTMNLDFKGLHGCSKGPESVRVLHV